MIRTKMTPAAAPHAAIMITAFEDNFSPPAAGGALGSGRGFKEGAQRIDHGFVSILPDSPLALRGVPSL